MASQVAMGETNSNRKESIPAINGFVNQSLSQRKKFFLTSLRGITQKYKRYVGIPLRYAGGKTLAVGFVVERIPDHITRIICPFLGGGSVEVACANELGLQVIAFDIFDILINYWKAQLKNPIALYERLSQFSPTRREFKRVKERLKKHWLENDKL
jgi:DNA adenine methylase